MSRLLNSPENEGRNLPAIPSQTQWYGPEVEPEEPTVPLSHYLWILKRHRWKILAFVFTCVVSTAIISSRLTPIYESTATVDIDRRMPTGVLGQDAQPAATNDADQFIATQVKLVQSDSVLRPVVEKYKVTDIGHDSWLPESQPNWLPENQPKLIDDTEAPVTLRSLKVTRPPNTYLLLISYRSPDPHLAADMANGIAQFYIEHTYNIRFRSSASLSTFMEKQLEELKAKMERSSEALAQFERELNVINPEEKTSILSARLLQLNSEYTNAQAERVKKEAAYNSVKSGTLEAVQASSQGEALKKLAENLNEAQAKMAQAAAQYGKHHPEYNVSFRQACVARSRAAEFRSSSLALPSSASRQWLRRWSRRRQPQSVGTRELPWSGLASGSARACRRSRHLPAPCAGLRRFPPS